MTTMGLAVSKHEAFYEACGFGHTEKVRKFIADGIDVNWKSYSVRIEKQPQLTIIYDFQKQLHLII